MFLKPIDPHIQSRVEILLEATKDSSRGDLIPWSMIEQLIGLQKADKQFRYIVFVWRTRLAQLRSIETVAWSKQGIRLCTHEDQVRLIPRLRARKIKTQCRLIKRSLDNSDYSALSSHDQVNMAKIYHRLHNTVDNTAAIQLFTKPESAFVQHPAAQG